MKLFGTLLAAIVLTSGIAFADNHGGVKCEITGKDGKKEQTTTTTEQECTSKGGTVVKS